MKLIFQSRFASIAPLGTCFLESEFDPICDSAVYKIKEEALQLLWASVSSICQSKSLIITLQKLAWWIGSKILSHDLCTCFSLFLKPSAPRCSQGLSPFVSKGPPWLPYLKLHTPTYSMLLFPPNSTPKLLSSPNIYVPLPFLKPAWTSGSLRFTYCWSLAWRILSITLLTCEMSTTVL